MGSYWRAWTTGEIHRLKAMWGKKTARQIGADLGRSRKAIELYARKLGLPRLDEAVMVYFWTPEQRRSQAERMGRVYAEKNGLRS